MFEVTKALFGAHHERRY